MQPPLSHGVHPHQHDTGSVQVQLSELRDGSHVPARASSPLSGRHHHRRCHRRSATSSSHTVTVTVEAEVDQHHATNATPPHADIPSIQETDMCVATAAGKPQVPDDASAVASVSDDSGVAVVAGHRAGSGTALASVPPPSAAIASSVPSSSSSARLPPAVSPSTVSTHRVTVSPRRPMLTRSSFARSLLTPRRPAWTVGPDHPIRQLVSFITLLCILFYAIVNPLRLCLTQDMYTFPMDLLFDYCCIDLLILLSLLAHLFAFIPAQHANTYAIHDIHSRHQIANTFLSGSEHSGSRIMLGIDILASMPIDLFGYLALLAPGRTSYMPVYALRMIKWLHVLSIFRHARHLPTSVSGWKCMLLCGYVDGGRIGLGGSSLSLHSSRHKLMSRGLTAMHLNNTGRSMRTSAPLLGMESTALSGKSRRKSRVADSSVTSSQGESISSAATSSSSPSSTQPPVSLSSLHHIGLRPIARILCAYLLLMHLFACFWCMATGGTSRLQRDWSSDSDNDSDSDSASSSEVVLAPSQQYLQALYYAVTTFSCVGYGDVTPRSSSEVGVTILMQLCGFLCMGGLIAHSVPLLARLQTLSHSEADRLTNWNAFFEAHAIPREVRERIVEYYKHIQKRQGGVAEEQILGQKEGQGTAGGGHHGATWTHSSQDHASTLTDPKIQPIPSRYRIDLLMHTCGPVLMTLPVFRSKLDSNDESPVAAHEDGGKHEHASSGYPQTSMSYPRPSIPPQPSSPPLETDTGTVFSAPLGLLRAMVARMAPRTYCSGDIVLFCGQRNDHLFVLARGEVAMVTLEAIPRAATSHSPTQPVGDTPTPAASSHATHLLPSVSVAIDHLHATTPAHEEVVEVISKLPHRFFGLETFLHPDQVCEADYQVVDANFDMLRDGGEEGGNETDNKTKSRPQTPASRILRSSAPNANGTPLARHHSFSHRRRPGHDLSSSSSSAPDGRLFMHPYFVGASVADSNYCDVFVLSRQDYEQLARPFPGFTLKEIQRKDVELRRGEENINNDEQLKQSHNFSHLKIPTIPTPISPPRMNDASSNGEPAVVTEKDVDALMGSNPLVSMPLELQRQITLRSSLVAEEAVDQNSWEDGVVGDGTDAPHDGGQQHPRVPPLAPAPSLGSISTTPFKPLVAGRSGGHRRRRLSSMSDNGHIINMLHGRRPSSSTSASTTASASTSARPNSIPTPLLPLSVPPFPQVKRMKKSEAEREKRMLAGVMEGEDESSDEVKVDDGQDEHEGNKVEIGHHDNVHCDGDERHAMDMEEINDARQHTHWCWSLWFDPVTLIDAASLFRSVWDGLLFLLLLYLIIVVPFQAAFLNEQLSPSSGQLVSHHLPLQDTLDQQVGKSTSSMVDYERIAPTEQDQPRVVSIREWAWLVFSWMVDLAFILDVVLRMNKLKPEKGNELMDEFMIGHRGSKSIAAPSSSLTHCSAHDRLLQERAWIRRRYVRSTAFMLDVFGVIPLEIFVLAGVGSQWLYILRLNRLIRLHRFPSLLSRVEVGFHRAFPRGLIARLMSRYSNLLYIIFYCILFCQVVGCMWFALSYFITWTGAAADGSTWIWVHGIVQSPISEQYVRSFTFVLVTIACMGYGGIVPQCTGEYVFVIFVALIGVAMYVTLMATLTVSAEHRNASTQQAQQFLQVLRHYLSTRRVDPSVRRKVLRNFQQMDGSGMDVATPRREDCMVNGLPPLLKIELLAPMLAHTLAKLPLFANLSDELLDLLLARLESRTYASGDVLSYMGERSTKTFLIHRGTIEVRTTITGTMRTIKTIGMEESFGSECLLHERPPERPAMYVAQRICHVFVLRKCDFDDLLQLFPEDDQRIQSKRAQMLGEAAPVTLTLPATTMGHHGRGASHSALPKHLGTRAVSHSAHRHVRHAKMASMVPEEQESSGAFNQANRNKDTSSSSSDEENHAEERDDVRNARPRAKADPASRRSRPFVPVIPVDSFAAAAMPVAASAHDGTLVQHGIRSPSAARREQQASTRHDDDNDNGNASRSSLVAGALTSMRKEKKGRDMSVLESASYYDALLPSPLPPPSAASSSPDASGCSDSVFAAIFDSLPPLGNASTQPPSPPPAPEEPPPFNAPDTDVDEDDHDCDTALAQPTTSTCAASTAAATAAAITPAVTRDMQNDADAYGQTGAASTNISTLPSASQELTHHAPQAPAILPPLSPNTAEKGSLNIMRIKRAATLKAAGSGGIELSTPTRARASSVADRDDATSVDGAASFMSPAAAAIAIDHSDGPGVTLLSPPSSKRSSARTYSNSIPTSPPIPYRRGSTVRGLDLQRQSSDGSNTAAAGAPTSPAMDLELRARLGRHKSVAARKHALQETTGTPLTVTVPDAVLQPIKRIYTLAAGMTIEPYTGASDVAATPLGSQFGPASSFHSPGPSPMTPHTARQFSSRTHSIFSPSIQRQATGHVSSARRLSTLSSRSMNSTMYQRPGLGSRTVTRASLRHDTLSSLFTEEGEKIDLRFLPNSLFRNVWSLIGGVGLLWLAFVVPYRICFLSPFMHTWSAAIQIQQEAGEDVAMPPSSMLGSSDWQLHWSIYVDSVFDLYFIIDMYLCMTKFAYYADGLLVSHPSSAIRSHYLRASFFLDLIGTFVFDLLILCMDSTSGVWILYWLRVLRLVRLHRVHEYLEVTYDGLDRFLRIINLSLINILMQWLLIAIVFHWLACGWYLVGLSDNTAASWLSQRDAPIFGMQLGTPSQQSHPPSSYIYIECLYFIVVTMSTVGYGDIRPRTVLESWFATLTIFGGLLIYASVTANIASLAANMDLASGSFQQKLDHAKAFMKRKEIHPHLKARIDTYYRMQWQQFKGVREEEILASLPSASIQDIQFSLYGYLLLHCGLFSEPTALSPSAASSDASGDHELIFKRPFLRSVAALLRHRSFVDGETVYQKGEYTDYCLLIRRGALHAFALKPVAEPDENHHAAAAIAVDQGDLEHDQPPPVTYKESLVHRYTKNMAVNPENLLVLPEKSHRKKPGGAAIPSAANLTRPSPQRQSRTVRSSGSTVALSLSGSDLHDLLLLYPTVIPTLHRNIVGMVNSRTGLLRQGDTLSLHAAMIERQKQRQKQKQKPATATSHARNASRAPSSKRRAGNFKAKVKLRIAMEEFVRRDNTHPSNVHEEDKATPNGMDNNEKESEEEIEEIEENVHEFGQDDDAVDEDEEAPSSVDSNRPWIISRTSFFRLWWDLFALVFVILYLLSIPLLVALSPTSVNTRGGSESFPFSHGFSSSLFWPVLIVTYVFDIFFGFDFYLHLRRFEKDKETLSGNGNEREGRNRWSNATAADGSTKTDNMSLAEVTAHGVDGSRDMPLKPSDITRNYLFGRRYGVLLTILELLSGTPWDIIALIYAGATSSPTVTLQFVALLRLGRVLYIARVPTYLSSVDLFLDRVQLHLNFQLLRIIKLSVVIVVVLHWMSCAWYLLALHPYNGGFTPNLSTNATVGSPPIYGLEGIDGSVSSISWLTFGPHSSTFLSAGRWEHYLWSLYWSIATLTTSGFGDLKPTNQGEMLLNMLMILAGDIVYGAIIGGLCVHAANKYAPVATYTNKMARLMAYLRHRNIPTRLQQRLLRYEQYMFDKTHGLDAEDKDVTRDLSSKLRSDVLYSMHESLLLAVPFFEGCSQHFLSGVATLLREHTFLPGEIVYHQGDVGESLYILTQGEMRVTIRRATTDNVRNAMVPGAALPPAWSGVGPHDSGSHDTVVQRMELDAPSIFGEVSFFLGTVRTATVSVAQSCLGGSASLLELRREDFDQLLQYFPHYRKRNMERVIATIVPEAARRRNKNKVTSVHGDKSKGTKHGMEHTIQPMTSVRHASHAVISAMKSKNNETTRHLDAQGPGSEESSEASSSFSSSESSSSPPSDGSDLERDLDAYMSAHDQSSPCIAPSPLLVGRRPSTPHGQLRAMQGQGNSFALTPRDVSSSSSHLSPHARNIEQASPSDRSTPLTSPTLHDPPTLPQLDAAIGIGHAMYPVRVHTSSAAHAPAHDRPSPAQQS